MYIYIYIYIFTYTYIHTYIHRSKEVLELAYAAIGQNYGATKITDHHSSLLLSMVCIGMYT